MTEEVTLDELAARLLSKDMDRRRIVGLAGSPGAGKSTMAEQLKALLDARAPACADILPMDGYHYDDLVLNARGHRPRKGAPHTFDLDGFGAMLDRVKLDDGRDIAVPVFDRSIEIARAGARIISAGVRIIIAEGNYLLLDEPGWRDLRSRFDLAVFIQASEDVLVGRLTERWNGFGYTPEMLATKMEGNDLPNMRLVLTKSAPADLVVLSDSA